MLRDLDQSSLSELESEYELEMDDSEFEFEGESEYEFGDTEYESPGDYEDELDGEYEGAADSEDEFDGEYEYESQDGETSQYGDRLYELAQMEFESESELDQEVNGILNEMEQDFFWKAAKRFIKKRGPGIMGKLGKFALSKSPFGQAFKGFSQLAKGNLKGALAGLAKTALSAHPGMAAAMPALNALGFEASEDAGSNREAWNNYAEVAREAYENLAANINPKAANPAVASDLAKRALQSALSTARTRVGRRVGRMGGRKPRGRKRVVHLAPGEYLVVVRKRR
jgi:hypothetical protein